MEQSRQHVLLYQVTMLFEYCRMPERQLAAGIDWSVVDVSAVYMLLLKT